MTGRWRLEALAWIVLSGACREQPAPTPPPPSYRDVVAYALRDLEAELGTDAGAAAETVAPEPAVGAREVTDLLRAAAADPRMRDLVLADLAALGPRAREATAEILAAGDAELELREIAAAALGFADSAPGAGALLGALEDPATPPSLRAHAAFALSQGSQDWVVPRLIGRLRYEVDREAWIWAARALCRFHNYAGLEGLIGIVGSEAEDEVWRREADAFLGDLAREFEFESPELMRWHWDQGNLDGRLPPELTSARQRLEIWRCVRDLGEFQLRPVDDARFVLSHMGEPAANILAEALADSAPHIRLHAAQTLARMGPRGASAGSALVLALDDPVAGVEAAHALGKIGVPSAESALTRRLSPDRDLALRVAAADALGWIGLPSSAAAFAPLLAPDAPVDLRVAAAAGRLRTARPEDVRPSVELLLSLFDDPRLDPARPEAELGAWLERVGRGDSALAPAARELLAAWHELEPASTAGPRDPAAENERRRARRELLSAALDALPFTRP